MKKQKLNIGRIPYANLYPIYYYLDNKCKRAEYKFVKGVPSKLNLLLREGELDISPSSSIEYLKNKNRYLLLPWFSISSSGPINSIFLFTNCPMNELGGKTIAVTSESATSTALLKIIMKEFLFMKCRFVPVTRGSVKSILSEFSAVLHIGDTAMAEARKAKGEPAVGRKREMHIYDLGDFWYEYTGLPFVYALWVVRKANISLKKDLISQLARDLTDANRFASKNFREIAKTAPQREWLSEKELVDYWEKISYGFTARHLEGLCMFEKYIRKLRL